MSRLESNAEPSMEEILASIRKIIAEDSSGMRPASLPTRPGTPYSSVPKTPAPQPSQPSAPQRGFMTREAFLKSSQLGEPEPRKEASSVGIPRSSGSNAGIAASATRIQPREEAPLSSRPSSSFREREISPPVRDPLSARQDSRSNGASSTPANDASKPFKPETSESARPSVIEAAEPATIETVEVVAIEDALPIVKENEPAVLKAEAEETPESNSKSDAERIEAQLNELLSEDLNALRQSRVNTEERAGPAEISEKASRELEGGDPFAFNLGPSPFAVKSEPQARPEPAIRPYAPQAFKPAPLPESIKPATSGPERTQSPAQISPTDQAKAEVRSESSEPSFTRQNTPSNGTAFAPFVPSNFAPPAGDIPTKSEAEATAKERQTFAIPSVSATLGPFRKLEPLSNAFVPPPAPPPSPLETFSPAPETVPEPPRSARPVFQQEEPRPFDASLPPEQRFVPDLRGDPEPKSALPATFDSSLDRPMEDAVADLLRPLLKTWLAENMPKIVERALRREMTERLLPGQKNSRD